MYHLLDSLHLANIEPGRMIRDNALPRRVQISSSDAPGLQQSPPFNFGPNSIIDQIFVQDIQVQLLQFWDEDALLKCGSGAMLSIKS